jgi:hypothetical protein
LPDADAIIPIALPNVSDLFHNRGMERVAPAEIAATILSAPAWARVGITAPDERLREAAALELARCLSQEDIADDSAQLCLTL